MKTLTNLFIRSLLLIAVTVAQWSSDPSLPQLMGTGVQSQIAATSDGGVYIAWLTDGNYHVYIQRLDEAGEAQFDASGLLVSDNSNSSWIAVYHLNLTVDTDDNAIITTVDERTGNWEVYAWKIAPDGTMLWGDDGVAITTSSEINMSPRLTLLPDNSVVVTCTHNNNTVIFQRISSAGTLLWGDGLQIEDNNASLVSPQPTVTAEGNVLIQWIRQTGSPPYYNSELCLQAYDLDGNPLWSEPTVAVGPVVFPMGNWSQQSVSEAGGGSFSAWTQFSGNVQNAVSQQVTGEGAIAWTGGVDLSTNSSNFRMSPMLSVAEDTQELMAVWREANGSQSERGIFAQRLDSSGNQLWGSTGATMVALNSSYDYLDLSVAGFGEELISAYIQQSANMSGDIYANRLDAEGNLVWTDETVTVTNSGTPKSDMMIGKGPNCLFITWSENGSVYAHCLRDDGTLGVPDLSGGPGDVLLVPSEYATIQDAIDASEDRDTIIVAPGTYVENINFNGKNIVVGSYYMTYGVDYFIAQTVISGDSNGSVVTFESGEDSTAVLIGFTFQDIINESEDGPQTIITINESSPMIVNNRFNNFYLFQDVESAVIYCENSNSLIMNNIFTDGTIGNGYVLAGYILSKYSSLTISNNRIENGYVGFAEPSGYIVSIASENIIESNIIINTSMGYCTVCATISILDGSDCIIRNNLISQAYGDGYGAVVASESQYVSNNNTFVSNSLGYANLASDGVVSNDIIYGTSNPVYIDENSNIQVSYSDIEGGWEGEGNIDTIPLFCNPDSGDFTLAENSPCVGTGQDGANIGALDVGCEAILSTDVELIPLQFALNQNYPNPFNPVTTLRYELPENALVNITIYDMMGRVVSNLVSNQQRAGYKSVQWNATNNTGQPVSAGIYLYTIQAGEFRQTKKMVLLK